jgi:hypothetical protein
MTKPKAWLDLTLSLDADWPPRQPVTLTELVAEARAADWEFTNWCCASGYDASDPDARRMFEFALTGRLAAPGCIPADDRRPAKSLVALARDAPHATQLWQGRTNVWRRVTSPARWAKRLRSGISRRH